MRTVHPIDYFTTPGLATCHERAIVRPFAHVCVSAAVAVELRESWGIEATVIPNGVDAERFAAVVRDEAEKRRRCDELGDHVLAVGGIEPRKGTLDLLEAYAILRESAPGIQLVIAGGETLFDYRDYRAPFDRRAAELGVRPLVLGTVDHAHLPSS